MRTFDAARFRCAGQAKRVVDVAVPGQDGAVPGQDIVAVQFRDAPDTGTLRVGSRPGYSLQG
jgi:hypothetical protein